jgi:cytochrome c553
VCHGVDADHPDNPETQVPTDTIELCTICHQAMPARPAVQPQIVMAEHPSPDEAGEQCHSCHDAHSPGGGERTRGATDAESPAAVSADSPTVLLTAVSTCARCHGEFGEGRRKNPAISGMESGTFVDLMNMYASGAREHKAMNKYASELSAEEIVALSSYYQDLAVETQD